MTRSEERSEARSRIAALAPRDDKGTVDELDTDVGPPPPALPRPAARTAPVPAVAPGPGAPALPNRPPGEGAAGDAGAARAHAAGAPATGAGSEPARGAGDPSDPPAAAAGRSAARSRPATGASAHSFSLTAEAHKRFGQARRSGESASETLLRLVGTAVPRLRDEASKDLAQSEPEALYGLFPAVASGPRKRRGIERRDLRVWMYQAHRDVLSDLAAELTGGNVSQLVTDCIVEATTARPTADAEVT